MLLPFLSLCYPAFQSIKDNLSDFRQVALLFILCCIDYSPLTAATPGRTFPSIASRRAPPPVEM